MLYFADLPLSAFICSVWATAPDADLPIKMGEAGTAAGRPATTVFKVFQKTVESHGDKPALKFKDLSEAGVWLGYMRGFLAVVAQ